MNTQSDIHSQAGSGCHVIPGSAPSEKGLQLDLKIGQTGSRSLLCIHFRGHSHCRETIEVDTEALVGVLSKYSGSTGEV